MFELAKTLWPLFGAFCAGVVVHDILTRLAAKEAAAKGIAGARYFFIVF